MGPDRQGVAADEPGVRHAADERDGIDIVRRGDDVLEVECRGSVGTGRQHNGRRRYHREDGRRLVCHRNDEVGCGLIAGGVGRRTVHRRRSKREQRAGVRRAGQGRCGIGGVGRRDSKGHDGTVGIQRRPRDSVGHRDLGRCDVVDRYREEVVHDPAVASRIRGGAADTVGAGRQSVTRGERRVIAGLAAHIDLERRGNVVAGRHVCFEVDARRALGWRQVDVDARRQARERRGSLVGDQHRDRYRGFVGRAREIDGGAGDRARSEGNLLVRCGDGTKIRWLAYLAANRDRSAVVRCRDTQRGGEVRADAVRVVRGDFEDAGGYVVEGGRRRVQDDQFLIIEQITVAEIVIRLSAVEARLPAVGGLGRRREPADRDIGQLGWRAENASREEDGLARCRKCADAAIERLLDIGDVEIIVGAVYRRKDLRLELRHVIAVARGRDKMDRVCDEL